MPDEGATPPRLDPTAPSPPRSKQELEAWLPRDRPPKDTYVYWCGFSADGDLSSFRDALAALPNSNWSIDENWKPALGHFECLFGAVPKRRVGFMIYAMSGAWQLEVAFARRGHDWGENEAIYAWYKARILPAIGARDVVERTE